VPDVLRLKLRRRDRLQLARAAARTTERVLTEDVRAAAEARLAVGAAAQAATSATARAELR